MVTGRLARAFTLVELLVVIAIISLLMAIVMPSLQGAREAGKRTKCLANLQQLAQASHAYSDSDPRGILIPMHKMNVRTEYATGLPDSRYGWLMALRFAFGGRTPVIDMPTAEGPIAAFRDNDRWGAPSRPLNRHLYGDLHSSEYQNQPLFRCPSDAGYPDTRGDWWGAYAPFPPKAAEIPCYDYLGNSYRFNDCGEVYTQGQIVADLSTGPHGRSLSNIENVSRTVLYAEPRFLWWAGGNQTQRRESCNAMSPGWHKTALSDNVAFCDGSVRLVSAGQPLEFDAETLQKMRVTPFVAQTWWGVLRRGPGWQMDCYPSSAVLIRTFNPDGTAAFAGIAATDRGWPFDGSTMNPPP